MNNRNDKCEECGADLMLCLADWPWSPNYWICSECDSTYCIEDE